MRIIAYILLPALFIAGNFFCGAQITVFNTGNSGLPDNRVNKVVVDKNQNVWCATENGVARYDGANWVVYNSTNSGLTDNYTRSIAFDTLGRLWVGTLSSGVFIYDGVTWQQMYTGNSGLTDDCIKEIQFDANGDVWLGTTGGLQYYDSTSWTVWNVFNSIFYTNNISFIRFKGNEKHVGTVNGGLHILDGSNNITNYNTFNSGIHDNTLPDGEWDANGALWMATPAAALIIHYNGNTWQWFYTGTSNIPTNSLNAVCRYGSRFYFTSYDNGLIRYNAGNFTWLDTLNSNMPENYLLDVSSDTLGNLWVGSYQSGLIKVVEPTLEVTGHEVNNEWGILQNCIRPGDFLVLHAPINTRCDVYDAEGRLLISKPLDGGILSLPGLGQGWYVLQMTSDNRTQSFKFIISN